MNARKAYNNGIKIYFIRGYISLVTALFIRDMNVQQCTLFPCKYKYYLRERRNRDLKMNPDLWFGSQTAETINQVCHWQTDYKEGGRTMLGGKAMKYNYVCTPSVIHFSGETGKNIFKSILCDKTEKFDVKKASKKAHKNLRKQGFYM